MIKKISIETEEGTYAGDMVFTPNLPPPPPPSVDRKYIMLNCINWSLFTAHDFENITEATYFVLLVSKEGTLYGAGDTSEKYFVEQVRLAGCKATFSVGGGTQSIPDITTAVTTNATKFILNICQHIKQFGYDGITIDIENTNIPAQAMADFVRLLRIAMDNIKLGLIIGIYTQPFQLNTVWAKIQDSAQYFTWISPMLYDAGVYDREDWIAYTNNWLPRVNGDKSKLLAGLAINYPSWAGGLNEIQYAEMLDVTNEQGWGGAGIWQHALYRQPFKDIQKAKFPVIL